MKETPDSAITSGSSKVKESRVERMVMVDISLLDVIWDIGQE